MCKKIVFHLIVFIFAGIVLKAQPTLKDNVSYCEQYSKIIEVISNDSIVKMVFPFKKFVFEISNKMGYGIGCPFMTRYYVAETLGVNPENLDLKDSTLTKLLVDTEKEEYNKAELFEISLCLTELQREKRGFNVYLSFARKGDKFVFVNASRIYKHPRHTNGIYYLFLFNDKNDIAKIYRTKWIE